MKSNYKRVRLGNYIERITRRNTEQKYSIDDVRGVTNTKKFAKTKANLLGRTFEKFYIVKPKEFVFNRRTTRMGERFGLGYNKYDREYIFTEDYVPFRIKDEALSLLMPEYLYLFFCRDEFDRYVRYQSAGSATEFFNWEDMCKVALPVPPLEKQAAIVRQYKTIADRIALKQRINDNLEAMTQILYQHIFIDNPMAVHWQQGLVSDVLQLQRGYDLPRDVMDGGIYPVIGSTEIIGHHSLFTTDSPAIVMGRSGNIGNPRIYFQKCWVHNTALYVKKIYSANPIWAFFMLKNINYDEFSGGSAVPTLNRNFVHSFPITIPPLDLQNKFAKKVIPMYEMQERDKTEICILKETAKYILSAFSHQ